MTPPPVAHALARLGWPGSARQLAFVRIVVCLHVGLVLMSPAIDVIFAVPAHVMPWAKSALPESLERLVAANVFALLRIGMVAALFAVIGLFTRVALALTGLCFFFTQNFWFRMSLFHDDWLYFNFYLLLLTLSPCADDWSVDAWLRARRGLPAVRGNARHRLAIELMGAWFAGLYVAAGIAKLFPLVTAWSWLSGARTQDFACEFLLDSPIFWLLGRPPFDYTTTRWPFAIAAILTLVIELGAVTLVLGVRYRWLVLTAILAMHFGIMLMGIPGFVQAAAVAMTVFIPPTWLGERTSAGRRVACGTMANARTPGPRSPSLAK